MANYYFTWLSKTSHFVKLQPWINIAICFPHLFQSCLEETTLSASASTNFLALCNFAFETVSLQFSTTKYSFSYHDLCEMELNILLFRTSRFHPPSEWYHQTKAWSLGVNYLWYFLVLSPHIHLHKLFYCISEMFNVCSPFFILIEHTLF